jgi:hypothetical protein
MSFNRGQVSRGVIFMARSAVAWQVNGLTHLLRGAARFHGLIIAVVFLRSVRRLAKAEKRLKKAKARGEQFSNSSALRNTSGSMLEIEPDPIVVRCFTLVYSVDKLIVFFAKPETHVD